MPRKPGRPQLWATKLAGRLTPNPHHPNSAPLTRHPAQPHDEAISHPKAARRGDLAWLERHVTVKSARSVRYPLTVARNLGAHALSATPLISVSTIHSVKGAEADVVYLFPDISRAAWGELNGGPADARRCTASSTSG